MTNNTANQDHARTVATVKYNKLQASVLSGLTNGNRLKALKDLTGGNEQGYFFNVFGEIFQVLAKNAKGDNFSLLSVENELIKNSKKYNKRTVNMAIGDIEAAEVLTDGGFKARVARLVYFKNSYDKEIKKDLTCRQPQQNTNKASEGQRAYLGFIRGKLKLDKWKDMRNELNIENSIRDMTPYEAGQVIDYYVENHEGK